MPLVWRLPVRRAEKHERARGDNLIVVGHLSVLTTGESLSAAADTTRRDATRKGKKVIYVVFLLLR